jgi:hypothetical protein
LEAIRRSRLRHQAAVVLADRGFSTAKSTSGADGYGDHALQILN